MQMSKVLFAAAIAALLAAPAFAQNAPSSTMGGGQSTQQLPDQQNIPGQPGQGTFNRGVGNIPTDCLPSDTRPECQTAQLPGSQQNPAQSPSGGNYGSAPDQHPPLSGSQSGSGSMGGGSNR
jgi:hypothetical protein